MSVMVQSARQCGIKVAAKLVADRQRTGTADSKPAHLHVQHLCILYREPPLMIRIAAEAVSWQCTFQVSQ